LQESKIQEAFEMLRKQGVATDDHVSSPCPLVQPRNADKTSVFEDDEKSKLLKRLLQSKHPDDLQAANRLIKSMVREDEKRTERQCKATSKVDQVQNNCQLLMEMLTHYDKSGKYFQDCFVIKITYFLNLLARC
jgi:ADP-ribosylation factor-binding protein GGA